MFLLSVFIFFMR